MTIAEDEKTPEQVAAIENAMRAEGQPTHDPVPVDYFNCEQRFTVVLPDGVQKIVHQTFTEGKRKEYLNKTNSELKVQRATGDSIMNMKAGDNKHILLALAIVDWELIRDGEPLPFNRKVLVDEVLVKFPPDVIDLVEADIRKHNPWLQADMTIEDIDHEIASLEAMKAEKVKEEAGKIS